MPDAYEQEASVYDAIYTQMKDYAKEAERVRGLITENSRIQVNSLLDVACGTGLHDQFLAEYYRLEGLDFSLPMLAEAKKRLPDVMFHHGDMGNFDLGKQFDAVTCLFSAIGHMVTLERLQAAISCMAYHLKPGGVLIIEPFIDPADWRPGTVNVNLVANEKIVRVTKSELEGHVAHLNMRFFTEWDEEAGTARFFTSKFPVAMYTRDEFTAALTAVGLDVVFDEVGLMGRGLYIGIKNS